MVWSWTLWHDKCSKCRCARASNHFVPKKRVVTGVNGNGKGRTIPSFLRFPDYYLLQWSMTIIMMMSIAIYKFTYRIVTMHILRVVLRRINWVPSEEMSIMFSLSFSVHPRMFIVIIIFINLLCDTTSCPIYPLSILPRSQSIWSKSWPIFTHSHARTTFFYFVLLSPKKQVKTRSSFFLLVSVTILLPSGNIFFIVLYIV